MTIKFGFVFVSRKMVNEFLHPHPFLRVVHETFSSLYFENELVNFVWNFKLTTAWSCVKNRYSDGATRLSSIGLAPRENYPTEVERSCYLDTMSHNFAIAKDDARSWRLAPQRVHHRHGLESSSTQSRALLSRHLVMLGDFPLSLMIWAWPEPGDPFVHLAVIFSRNTGFLDRSIP